MNLKSVFLISLLFLAVSIQAQRGNFNFNPEERAQKETARMTSELTLSDAQVVKVGEVNLKYANQMSELFKAEDRSLRHEQMKTLRTEKAEEIKKYLTAEQFENYKLMRKERSQRKGKSKAPQNEG